MTNQGGGKFTWMIKDPCYWPSETCHSGIFEIGGCNCNLSAYFSINDPEILAVNLAIAYGPSLGRRYVKYRLTLVNQLSEESSIWKGGLHWFDSLKCELDVKSEFFFSKLFDEDGGFLVNEEVKVVIEVGVLEVIDKLDMPEEFKKTTEENNSDVSTLLLKESSTIKESIDVNGFQVFPSQVESLRRIFERHPDTTVGFRSKNQHLRKSSMISLLNIIEMLCQSLQELSNEDLVEAEIALTHLKVSGFKVEWLEKKLDRVKGRKEKELSMLALLQETEEKILKLKQRCALFNSLAEEQKELLLATRTPLSFDELFDDLSS